MKSTTEVSNLINCLTHDEDLRQDLWVYYLSGNSVDTFSFYLRKLLITREDIAIQQQICNSVWLILQDPTAMEFSSFLDNFSNFERSVMCLLAIGLTVEQIAEYKGISPIRIRQTLYTIRYNSMWNSYYGTKAQT